LRDFDTSTRNPGASRHTEGALERATEVADADAEKRGEIPDWNRGRKIRVDMYDEPMRLPGREAATLYSCCSTLAGALGSCWRTRMRVEERQGTRDMRLGGFAVTITSATRRLDEFSRRGYGGSPLRALASSLERRHARSLCAPQTAFESPFRGEAKPIRLL
jgi:hypothetical protein